MPRRHTVSVQIKWESRTDEQGRGYAVLRWTENGKRSSRSLGFVTTDEAERLRIAHEAALRLQVASPIDSSVVRVADVLMIYLTDLDRRPVTKAYAELELKRCERLRHHLGHFRAEAVTSDLLSRYLGDRRREVSRFKAPPKKSSLMMEVDTLRRAYAVAARQRVIGASPLDRPSTKLPEDRRPARRLTEAEVSRLVAAGHRDLDGQEGPNPRGTSGFGWLVQVLAWSGRRPVAVLDLEVSHLSRLLDPNLPREEQLVYWRRDKGGQSRGWGPVTEAARNALIARAREVGEGRLWSQRAAKALFVPLRRVAKAAGVEDVQAYDLRRFGVTKIVHACRENLRSAMQFTGHRSVQTLLRYLYSEVGHAEDLAATIGWSGPREVVAGVVATDGSRRSDAD